MQPKHPNKPLKQRPKAAGMAGPGTGAGDDKPFKKKKPGAGRAGGGAGPGGRRAAQAPRGLPAGAITLANHALIYLNVPKSACTTIKNQLYFVEHGRYIDEPLDIHAHDGLLRSRESTPENLALFNGKLSAPHMVFTFVRHPGKRAYSCFGEKIFNQSKYSFPKVRDYIAEKYKLALPEPGDASYDLARHRANFMCFLDFVADNFDGKTEIRTDAHWGRQSTIIEHFQRFFFVDFVGRVEDFERQFRFVLDQTPLRHRPDLGVRFNEGPKPPFSYEQIADAAVEARLREIYADDYFRLGYGSDASTGS